MFRLDFETVLLTLGLIPSGSQISASKQIAELFCRTEGANTVGPMAYAIPV